MKYYGIIGNKIDLKSSFKLNKNMYYKNSQLLLSQDCLQDYPKQFYQKYKDYEFLECVVYLKNPDDQNKISYFLGRFKGINKDDRYGITRVTIYDKSTNATDFDLLYLISYSIFLDNRMKYHCHQYPIYSNGSCVYINIYPMYQKQLLLLYFNLLSQKISLLPDCMDIISKYLKPKNMFDFEIVVNHCV